MGVEVAKNNVEPDNDHPNLVYTGAFGAYRRSKDEYSLDMMSYYGSYSKRTLVREKGEVSTSMGKR